MVAKQETIKEILMRRGGLTESEAHDQIEEAKEAFRSYLDDGDEEAAHNICEEYFGLEPDYIYEFF